MMSKRTLKNRFYSERLNIKQNTAKIGADFFMNFDSSYAWKVACKHQHLAFPNLSSDNDFCFLFHTSCFFYVLLRFVQSELR